MNYELHFDINKNEEAASDGDIDTVPEVLWEHADVVLVLYDVRYKKTLELAIKIAMEHFSKFATKCPAVIYVGNKIDVKEEETDDIDYGNAKYINPSEAVKLASEQDLKWEPPETEDVVEISVKEDQGFEILFDKVFTIFTKSKNSEIQTPTEKEKKGGCSIF